MNKLDAISMPDNDSNCPIKTRNDDTTPRVAIMATSMLSRTYLTIKCLLHHLLLACQLKATFWEIPQNF